jgi:hypothetical protein
MKKLIYSLLIFIGLTGCEKILEVEPTFYIDGEQAITNKRGVETALTGCYNALQQTGMYGRYLAIIPDLIADNLEWKGTTQEYGQFENNSLLADNIIVESVWNAHYNLLNRVNYVLYKLPEISDMSEAEKENTMAQLYFLRALTHFNLVRFYGPVPVKTQPTLNLGDNLNVPRNPVADVYEAILADLSAAEGKISVNNPGYATNGAVLALQADVALAMGNYELAREKATAVINGSYLLEPVYADLFQGEPGTEAIFTVLFNEQDGNRLAEYFFPTALGGRYEVAPSADLIASYDLADSIRLNASMALNPPYGLKYPDMVTMANNVPVYRLAEMYLIRAEAEARLQGSMAVIRNDINMLRLRAGIPTVTSDTYEQLLLDIEAERRREFAFEGKRWFDLIRTGRALEILPDVTSVNQLLLPIPLVELQNNNHEGMSQNTGY